VNDRNDFAELGLKGRVEICAALDRAEAVAVCEFGEDSDVAAVFELETCDQLPPSRQDLDGTCSGGYARVAMISVL